MPTLKTGHVALNVTDISKSLDFYRELFDFDVISSQFDGSRSFALVGNEGAVALGLFQQSDGRPEVGLPGLHHLSFEVATAEEVRTAEAKLKELGIEFAYDGVVSHGGGATSGGVFFYDPDGIRLEIYAPAGVAAHTAPVADAPTCGFF